MNLIINLILLFPYIIVSQQQSNHNGQRFVKASKEIQMVGMFAPPTESHQFAKSHHQISTSQQQGFTVVDAHSHNTFVRLKNGTVVNLETLRQAQRQRINNGSSRKAPKNMRDQGFPMPNNMSVVEKSMTKSTPFVRLLPTQTFARFRTTSQPEQMTKRTRGPPNSQRTTTALTEPTPPPRRTTTADWRTRSTRNPPLQRPPPGFGPPSQRPPSEFGPPSQRPPPGFRASSN